MKMLKDKKMMTAFTIVTALIAIIGASSDYFLRMYLSYRFKVDTSNAASIGIIGGSDGPTAIFLAGTPSSSSITIIFASLSIIGLVCLINIIKSHK